MEEELMKVEFDIGESVKVDTGRGVKTFRGKFALEVVTGGMLERGAWGWSDVVLSREDGYSETIFHSDYMYHESECREYISTIQKKLKMAVALRKGDPV